MPELGTFRRRMLAGLLLSVPSVAGCQETSSGAVRQETIAIGDSTVAKAGEHVARGRPWQATLLLEPVLRDSARRKPEALLIASRAAAAWNGWERVRSLLGGEPWVGERFGGEGLELLARASLASNDDSAAVAFAAAAAERAPPGPTQGVRLVLLARGRERLDHDDSAAAAYLRAAAALPEIGDWLRLRAAGTTADPAARQPLYERTSLPAARPRIPWTEAYARERSRDFGGAAVLFDSLGALVDGIRLRLTAARVAGDSAAIASARAALLDFVRQSPMRGDARDAVTLLDAHFAPLAPGEELIVARSAARTGPRERALRAFARGIAATAATPADRYEYALLLSRSGRERDAAREFARVAASKAPAQLVASAAYQRARSLLRDGQAAAARRELLRLLARHPSTEAAPAAMFLLADLDTDALKDADARRRLLELARRWPRSALAPRARLRAAIAAFASGSAASAARQLDTLARLHPASEDAAAARYWAGRAWAAAGQSRLARERWRESLLRDSLSYYAQLAAERLDTTAWLPAPDTSDAGSFAPDSPVVRAMERADLLERAGMAHEARLEYEQLAADAHESLPRLLATAEAFHVRGLSARTIQLGTRALARGAPRSARVYRLLYPLAYEDVLIAQARANGLEPALVAALVRQESHFDPRAVSRADARGLMQLLPSVGRAVARQLDYPVWSAEMLFEPEVSLELGTKHLASVLRVYGDTVRALAAYNAGGSRVVRWAAKRGAEDPEVFVERIPFVETRDYVRVIQRTRAWYRALYPW